MITLRTHEGQSDDEEEELIRIYGYWNEHPGYPWQDWVTEVANNDTRLGYWAWAVMKLEESEDEKE